MIAQVLVEGLILGILLMGICMIGIQNGAVGMVVSSGRAGPLRGTGADNARKNPKKQ